MPSNSTRPRAASRKLVLTPVMTLHGHKPDTPLLSRGGKLVGHTYNHISSICYFPGGKQLISGSNDETARRWDLQEQKEIVNARVVFKQEVCAVGVSRDGRWIVTASGTFGFRPGELRVTEVETGIVRTFEGHSRSITCIDISADSTLLASVSEDIIWIRSLETGNPVAVLDSATYLGGVIRFSPDSKKLAIKSGTAQCLGVWDVQAATYVRVGPQRSLVGIVANAPMFWTTKDTIVAGFNFHVSHRTSDSRDLKTIYEFDASTLQKVGVPFKGHTDLVIGLALSFDCALLASAAHDCTIKLWAFESRQLLASFDVQRPRCIIFSPDSRRLVYTAEAKIHICDIQCDILSGSLPGQEPNTSAAKTPRLVDLPDSDETSLAVYYQPVISHVRPFVPQPPRQSRTIYSQRPAFFRYLRELLPYSSRTNAAPLRNAVDVPRAPSKLRKLRDAAAGARASDSVLIRNEDCVHQ